MSMIRDLTVVSVLMQRRRSTFHWVRNSAFYSPAFEIHMWRIPIRIFIVVMMHGRTPLRLVRHGRHKLRHYVRRPMLMGDVTRGFYLRLRSSVRFIRHRRKLGTDIISGRMGW